MATITEKRAKELLRFHLEQAHELVQELDKLHTNHFHIPVDTVKERNGLHDYDTHIPLDGTIEYMISRYEEEDD